MTVYQSIDMLVPHSSYRTRRRPTLLRLLVTLSKAVTLYVSVFNVSNLECTKKI